MYRQTGTTQAGQADDTDSKGTRTKAMRRPEGQVKPVGERGNTQPEIEFTGTPQPPSQEQSRHSSSHSSWQGPE